MVIPSPPSILNSGNIGKQGGETNIENWESTTTLQIPSAS
jgi:hypothetical protein